MGIIGGHKLKALRQFLNLNQKEFAEKLKIKQSYYSAMERGENYISANVIKVLFEEIRVNPDWFYIGAGLPFDGSYTVMEHMNAFGEHDKIEMEKIDAELKRRKAFDLGMEINEKDSSLKSINNRLSHIEGELKRLKDTLTEFINVYKKDKS